MATEYRVPTLHQALADLGTPEGHRAELIGGCIVISPLPQTGHTWIIELLRDQIQPRVPEGTRATNMVRVDCPGPGNRTVPDLAVVPAALLREDVPIVAADVVELVCEATSPGSQRYDVVDKRLTYAGSDIPFYLLVDRKAAQVTLFHMPRAGDYEAGQRVPFGTELHIPEPFDLKLNTSDFPAYAAS